jgi:hypothetical protein
MIDMRHLIDLVESADRGLIDSAYIQSVVKRDQDERHEYSEFARRFDDWEQAASAYATQKGRPNDDVFGERAEQEKFIDKAKRFQFDKFSRQDWNDFWLMGRTSRLSAERGRPRIRRHTDSKSAPGWWTVFPHRHVRCG